MKDEQQSGSSFNWLSAGLGSLVTAPLSYLGLMRHELPKAAEFHGMAGSHDMESESGIRLENSSAVKKLKQALDEVDFFNGGFGKVEYIEGADKKWSSHFTYNVSGGTKTHITEGLSWDNLPASIREHKIRTNKTHIVLDTEEAIHKLVSKEILFEKLIPESERAQHAAFQEYARAFGLGFKDLTGMQKLKVTGSVGAATVGVGLLAGALMRKKETPTFAERTTTAKDPSQQAIS